MALLLEWPNENSHRYYPFDPPAGNSVPTALILDLGIIATTNLPDNSGESTTYISQIVTDGVHIRFYLAADVSGATIDFGCVAIVDVGAAVGTRTNFKYAGQGFVFEGFIVTGDTSVTAQMSATTVLDASSGKLYTGCIQHMSQWLAGVQIGDQTLSGLITLEAGAGVELGVEGNSIIVRCTGTDLPPDTTITSDSELFARLVSTFGAPITQINGKTPDAYGNISITSADTKTLLVETSNGVVTLKNLAAESCCSQNDIATLVSNIDSLNERVGVLDQFLNQVQTNLNVLSVQTTRLT